MSKEERRNELNMSAGYALAAERISEYLTLGMHHSTSEARAKMAEIIGESIRDRRREKYLRYKENMESPIYAEGMAVLSHNSVI